MNSGSLVIASSKYSAADSNRLLVSSFSSPSFSRPAIRFSSIPISPNSFSITAILLSLFSLRILLRRVVLPDPRNPVRMVTGIRDWAELEVGEAAGLVI